MVSKKLLKSYDFASIQDYYNYIADSYLNGQHTQVKKLCKVLSVPQRFECRDYLSQFQTLSPDCLTYINKQLSTI
jgi:hypothetical protein